MTFDNFTTKAAEALAKAQQIAAGNEQQLVDTAHIAKALLTTEDTIAFLLKKVNVDTKQLEERLDGQINSYSRSPSPDQQFLNTDANKAVQAAQRLAKTLGDEFIATEVLLLAIVSGNDATAKLFKELGATDKTLSGAIKELRKGRNVTSQGAENEYNALGKYAINLNAQAIAGKLDPIIGRDDEIRRILQILTRRKKNNPILRADLRLTTEN